jgi:predicted amidohydrolase YtcJ
MLKNGFIFIFLVFSLFSCSPKKQEADLLIWGAVIYSSDSVFSVYSAMAIKDGKVLEMGNEESLLLKYDAKHMLDLKGKTVFPGFIDAHCHFSGYATDMWKCDLRGTASFDEVLDRVKTYSKAAPMFWIYGRGWDQNDWKHKEFPDKTVLDQLFPDRPVFLKRIDGHAALVNQFALNLFRIGAKTKVAGGIIEIKDGKLTGILIDNAMDLIDAKIPVLSDSLARFYLKQAEQDCFALGLTGVHDCGISEHTLDLLDQEQKAGHLRMKVYALLNNDTLYYRKWLKQGAFRTPGLHLGGFKVYVDGALGSRGACLLKPYSDQPGWNGFLLTDTFAMRKLAEQLEGTNLQMCSHAIGDSANRQILKTYAAALKGRNNKRWRVEHAQVMNQSDYTYYSNFDIVPSVQPTHATSDMYWAGERLGNEREKNAYAYKSLLKAGGKIALGTDFPVEEINPIKTFYAAVYRKDAKGFPPRGYQTENALSREEAIRGMTIWAAWAAFEENEKGSLETGKAADFIVLNNDLMRCREKEVLKTKVLSTWLNGEKVYEAP